MAGLRHPGQVAHLIGQKVSARRVQEGLAVGSVARVLGIEETMLEAAERGEVNFTAEQIVELCTILRVLPSWFFEGLTPEEPNSTKRGI